MRAPSVLLAALGAAVAVVPARADTSFTAAVTAAPFTTQLLGNEIIPVLQAGVTKRESLADLTTYIQAKISASLTGGGGITPGSLAATLSAYQTKLTAGTDYLTPSGNGSELVGITAAQVGALAPTGSGASLTGIAAGQVGGLAASATTDATNAANIGSGTLSVGRLPQFTGPCGTASAGTATFNCNTLLGQANIWTGVQTFNGVTSFGNTVNFPNGSQIDTTSNGLYFRVPGTSGNFFVTTNGGTTTGNITANAGTFYAPVTIPATGVSANDSTAGTTANSQNRLSHVANASLVAGWANTAFPVRVDGYATPGDGGQRIMVYDPANPCGVGGHPAADGVTCVNSTVSGQAGSWNIDWSSVNNEAKPELFAGKIADTVPASGDIDASSAVQAAINTGKTVYLPLTYYLAHPVFFNTQAQIMRGANRLVSGFRIDGGFDTSAKGVLVFNPGARDPGPDLRDFSVSGGQPTTSTISGLVQYPPFINAWDTPRFHLTRLGLYGALTDVDMRGNTGGAYIDDLLLSAYLVGLDIDGALDTLRINQVHGFIFSINNTALQNTNVVWFRLGRVDDLKISNSLTYSGTGMSLFGSSGVTSPYNNSGGGGATGSVVNPDFDIAPLGVACSGGSVNFIGGYMASTAAMNVSGPCNLSFSHMILPASAVNSIAINHPGASVRLIDDEMSLNPTLEGTAVNMSSGFLQIEGGKFSFPNTGSPSYSAPKINVAAGTLMMTGVRTGDRGSGSGNTLLNIQADAFHVIANNSAPGWAITKPGSGAGAGGAMEGIYGPNALSPAGPN